MQCPHEKKESALRQLARTMKDKEIDDTDGIKILLKDAWVLIRPSGTEPIYRIFAEAKEPETAKNIAQEHKGMIENIIKEL